MMSSETSPNSSGIFFRSVAVFRRDYLNFPRFRDLSVVAEVFHARLDCFLGGNTIHRKASGFITNTPDLLAN